MAKKYRTENFSNPKIGAYVTVYQRPGEKVRLDLNFFDSDSGLAQALQLKSILIDAIKKAKEWNSENEL